MWLIVVSVLLGVSLVAHFLLWVIIKIGNPAPLWKRVTMFVAATLPVGVALLIVVWRLI